MAFCDTTEKQVRFRLRLTGAGTGVARGLALFLGVFSLLNVVGELRQAGFDANAWWIDLRPLPVWVARLLLFGTALLLLAYALQPSCRRRRARITLAATAGLLGFATANAIGFQLLAARGTIAAGCPVAFSWLVVAALLTVSVALWRRPLLGHDRPKAAERTALALGVAACLLGFPLAQMLCFGLTDYRRPADAVVVFGARVYANGQASLALTDRVRTACGLYRDGLVGKVIVSGGCGDGVIHETETMRRLALQWGVAPDDILVDAKGVNTEATARQTSALFETHGLGRVLAVSHFYHLPRIKLAYQRCGREIYTVPARQSRPLARLPWYISREVAALWVYYLRPLHDRTG